MKKKTYVCPRKLKKIDADVLFKNVLPALKTKGASKCRQIP